MRGSSLRQLSTTLAAESSKKCQQSGVTPRDNVRSDFSAHPVRGDVPDLEEDRWYSLSPSNVRDAVLLRSLLLLFRSLLPLVRSLLLRRRWESRSRLSPCLLTCAQQCVGACGRGGGTELTQRSAPPDTQQMSSPVIQTCSLKVSPDKKALITLHTCPVPYKPSAHVAHPWLVQQESQHWARSRGYPGTLERIGAHLLEDDDGFLSVEERFLLSSLLDDRFFSAMARNISYHIISYHTKDT
jgi:hypothetical protein